MNEERKNEIGEIFLGKNEIPIEKLKDLELQELIFLIFSAKYFKEQKTFINGNFDDKIEIFMKVLLEKIKTAEELYIAYDENTKYPYIDLDDTVWIFSKEEYAIKAKEHFKDVLIMLEIRKISKDEVMLNFAHLHRLGIEKIILDNGEYTVVINRNDVLKPPDWSNTPEIKIPVENPKLQHIMIKFFENIFSQNNFEGKINYVNELEDRMLSEIVHGRYLVPMQLIEKETSIPDENGFKTIQAGDTLNFANLVDQDDTRWLPAFTDWAEFEKMYDKNIWQSNVSSYEDLIAISEDMEGIVINCKGISLRINDENRKRIEEFIKEKTSPKETSVTEQTVEKDTEVMFGEPKDYPSKMITAVSEYMKKQKCIKRAYLRLMIKGTEKSFLIVVDFEGNKDKIFQGIADAAKPHLEGNYLDMAGMDKWAADAIEDVEPFYKKKFLGIF